MSTEPIYTPAQIAEINRASLGAFLSRAKAEREGTEPKYPRKMTRRIPDVPDGLETVYARPGFFLVPCEHATPDDIKSAAHPWVVLRVLPEGQLNDDDTTLAPDCYPPASDYWESAIAAELVRAKRKFPQWPTDPVHAAAIVSEEAGELVRAVNEACYEPHKGGFGAAITEAIQLGAVVRRFLESAGHYKVAPGLQHDQDLTT